MIQIPCLEHQIFLTPVWCLERSKKSALRSDTISALQTPPTVMASFLLLSLLLSTGFAFVPTRQLHHVAVPRVERTELFYKDELTAAKVPASEKRSNPQEVEIEDEPVLERAENYLTGSNLIYFFAALRMLSYTGYATTRFEQLDTFSRGESITSFKLLEFILQELDALVERNLSVGIDEKDWISNARYIRRFVLLLAMIHTLESRD